MPLTTESSQKAWDDLRREARKMESELDIKIAAYGKLCSNYEYGYSKGESGMATDQARRPADAAAPAALKQQLLLALLLPLPLPLSRRYRHPTCLLQTKCGEIERLLARLSDANDGMRSTLSGGADSRSHTLARHRDILHDFQQAGAQGEEARGEFRRLQSMVGAARDRLDLLGGAAASQHAGLQSQGNAGLLLRERGMLASTNAALDEVMGTAQAVSSGLGQQRGMFEGISGKMSSLGNKFPVVNTLMNAIRRRKNRDNLILAAVVAACTLFILVYWWNK
ncbi:hypothetical protein CHLNCDRAFT_133637 [Chlorella variabilis]|uniref:Golgi SNAP receptor complex member 1 n=1 Tax=Chlorella variabilis TaxID=554065 RepID=E1Z3H8_CHLVA|nr:hypothetical protein CHLNCDRAFT_133637 [Chlorella variabilis]EFN59854.1 hypothetical protein CHLNCDRAFT_133637 [Chlorella variabilis]|eukprot:XP_005851956.1 hypothetical protein CHLNCDRAFT_133637 [Chlorella variabilis]